MTRFVRYIPALIIKLRYFILWLFGFATACSLPHRITMVIPCICLLAFLLTELILNRILAKSIERAISDECLNRLGIPPHE